MTDTQEALRKERDRYHDALVARHGGEPVALLEELDKARAEISRLERERNELASSSMAEIALLKAEVHRLERLPPEPAADPFNGIARSIESETLPLSAALRFRFGPALAFIEEVARGGWIADLSTQARARSILAALNQPERTQRSGN